MSESTHLWRWEDVARMAGARPAAARTPGGEEVFSGVSFDSRTASPGEIFVALKGDVHDGHDHIAQALARGASGVLLDASRWDGDPSFSRLEKQGRAAWLLVDDTLRAVQAWGRSWRLALDPVTFAVTGSTGKTTTKDLMASAVSPFGPACAARASFNNDVGVPRTLLELRDHHTFLIAEIGMNHPGEIARLVDLVRPDVAVITSVGSAHVGELGGHDAIMRAKLEITQGLDPSGCLVLPDEPARLLEEARRTWKGRILVFGGSSRAEVRLAGAPSWSVGGTRMEVEGLPRPVEVKILGRGAPTAVLAALAACKALALPLEEAAQALSQAPPAAGRMVSTELGSIRVLQDFYNASPESSLAAVEFLVNVPWDGKRYLAFGGMAELGAFSRPCHEEVGRAAASCDGAFFYGAEARWSHEACARAGGSSSHYDDKDALVRDLAGALRPGDLVLIKGSRRSAMETVFASLRGLEGRLPAGGEGDGSS